MRAQQWRAFGAAKASNDDRKASPTVPRRTRSVGSLIGGFSHVTPSGSSTSSPTRPSACELREFFALVGAYDQSPDNPTIRRLQDELYGRAQDVLNRSERDAHIVYREQARMSRFVPS